MLNLKVVHFSTSIFQYFTSLLAQSFFAQWCKKNTLQSKMPLSNTIIKISVASYKRSKTIIHWEKKKMSLALPIRQAKTVAKLEKQSTEVESPSAVKNVLNNSNRSRLPKCTHWWTVKTKQNTNRESIQQSKTKTASYKKPSKINKKERNL